MPTPTLSPAVARAILAAQGIPVSASTVNLLRRGVRSVSIPTSRPVPASTTPRITPQ